jgi:uncharacterized protein (TIGR00369 family)
MTDLATAVRPEAHHVREAYTYLDPTELAAAAMTLDGLSFLRLAMTGDDDARPPIGATLDFALTHVDVGTATFTGTPKPWQYNPIGTVHGGVIATLLDSAAGCAVHSTLPAGRGYTSLDLSVRYLRPLLVGTGEVRAIGHVVSAGRRTAMVEARLVDANDKLIANATSTCLLFDLPSA